MSWTDVDPTGTLSAAASAVSLVGAVLRAAPALKNATSNVRSPSIAGPSPLQRSTTAPVPSAVFKDPERERRAYETVNYVLREFGNRLSAAGLVDEHALTKALTSATQHIEVKLFSGEVNRLFESLAPRLADPMLVNSVFTAIYFIGALIAQLTSSLPNYKTTYPRLGPRLVQQVFRTAIGEDAFKENLSANLDAYETLATTAGLLRPTDIGYTCFPGLPTLSPGRFSSKVWADVRSNKSSFDKLCKHFDRAGFPQPLQRLQEEVGHINDWRFLMSDSNLRAYDVEKADKMIGENSGRVIHWLICSADRIPPGQAIIVFYDQYIAIVKWLGERAGFRSLYPSVDLDMTGVHSQLDGRLRAVLNGWIILMSSENTRTARNAASTKWAEERARAAKQMPKAYAQPSAEPSQRLPVDQRQTTQIAPNVSAVGQPNVGSEGIPSSMQNASPPLEIQLNEVNRWFHTQLKPQCQVFIRAPPADSHARDMERRRIVDLTERFVLHRLDALQIPEGHPGRTHRSAMIAQAQQMLATLDTLSSPNQDNQALYAAGMVPGQNVNNMFPATSNPVEIGSPSATSNTSSPVASPPPYCPTISPNSATNAADGFPFQQKRTTVVRRKAPPPPKKTVLLVAKALYDFERDANDDEELSFKEGDELEIVEKSASLEQDGWCKVRVKGNTTKVGLAPLDYLEIISPTPIVPEKVPAIHPGAHLVADGDSKPILGHPVVQQTESNPPTQPLHVQPSNAFTSSSQNSQALNHAGPNEPVKVKNKLGKYEVAGFAVAGIGAAAGVGTLVQGFSSPSSEHSQTESLHMGHQSPAGHSQHPTVENNNDAVQQAQNEGSQPSTEPSQNQDDNESPQFHQAQASTIQDQTTTTDTVIVTESDTVISDSEYYDTSVPPATDISAFSGGFDPVPVTSNPTTTAISTIEEPALITNPAAIGPPLTMQDPGFTTPLAVDHTFVIEETTVSPHLAPVFDPALQEEPVIVSPFASMATPPPATPLDDSLDGGAGMMSPFTGYTVPSTANEPLNMVEEKGESVTVMTQESVETVDGGAVWTEVEDVEVDFEM
ncbi:uncharacterized protein KY384_005531 [Bacidia gigantensis]|uniref:uncharacterized protein n=1 Tax=Bacidia gigantensis TaxID=2732470 RepID=UPI001D051987|nr:uncharacterized protein KY384_005531 [Bacidia gigantensis]KAG8530049.1 hypothetical protein KY384_005531 [Bacidia gigantensis]